MNIKALQANFLIWLLSKFETKMLLYVFDKVNQSKIKNDKLDSTLVEVICNFT